MIARFFSRRWRASRRGRATAGIEFALAFPIMLLFMGAALDFGMINFYASGVEHAAAAGAQYALVKGNTVTGANVQKAIQGAVSLPVSVSATITVPGNATSPAAAPACGCVTGATGGFSVVAATCGSTCAIDGSAAVYYMYITASANYSPMVLNLSLAKSILGNSYSVSRSATVTMP